MVEHLRIPFGNLGLLLVLARRLVHLWRCKAGIEHHLGGWAAGSLAIFSIGTPIMLSLTIGTCFRVVAVLGFPSWAGMPIAAPGIDNFDRSLNR